MVTSDYVPFQVVSVPFPFTDPAQTKKRPALVVSRVEFGQQGGHSVLAMITSARNSRWPLDVAISDLRAAGLPAPSIVRMKLFTLDHRFILKTLGVLNAEDGQQVAQALAKLWASAG